MIYDMNQKLSPQAYPGKPWDMTQAQKQLRDYFGYGRFHPGQETVIQHILEGRDTLAIMPTGAGKSICYQIPALLFPGVTIVISPLISLMKDQVDGLRRMGIPAGLLNSSLSLQEARETYRELRCDTIKLLYIAPERLEAEGFMEFLTGLDVSMVAVDEAHCVSQWGHDFRPSYRRIRDMIGLLPERPRVTAFTATATDRVRQDILALLGLSSPFVLCTGYDRANLRFGVEAPPDRDQYVLEYMRSRPGVSGIVYCLTRKRVDKLAQFLTKGGISVLPYHAGLTDEERRGHQDAFRHDRVDVMVATNAFGMGIDKSNVRFVLHYGMPKTMESYYQEAGRAGRDGEEADCVLLYAPQDVVTNRYLIDLSGEAGKADDYKKLQDMVNYCHIDTCLRAYILSYFGEGDVMSSCDHCANCAAAGEAGEDGEDGGDGGAGDAGWTDITIEAQKIISCVIRMGSRYGSGLVAQVLRGAATKRILALGLDKLSTYGLLREYTEKEIKEIIAYLTARGYLLLSAGEYPVLMAGKAAREFLREKETLMMKRKLTRVSSPAREKAREDGAAGAKGKVAAGGRLTGEIRPAQAHSDLFEKLRVLRKAIAEKLQVPPFVIFSDASLSAMCSILPCTPEELLAVPGVGKYKLEQYGGEFLVVVRAYMEERGIEAVSDALLPVRGMTEPEGGDLRDRAGEEETSKEKKKPRTAGDTVRHSFALYQQGKSVDAIAAERGLVRKTIEQHLAEAYRMGLEIDPEDFIPEQYREALFAAIETHGTEFLKPIKEAVAGDVTYAAVRFAVELYKRGAADRMPEHPVE